MAVVHGKVRPLLVGREVRELTAQILEDCVVVLHVVALALQRAMAELERHEADQVVALLLAGLPLLGERGGRSGRRAGALLGLLARHKQHLLGRAHTTSNVDRDLERVRGLELGREVVELLLQDADRVVHYE